jgi:hypothetical protein
MPCPRLALNSASRRCSNCRTRSSRPALASQSRRTSAIDPGGSEGAKVFSSAQHRFQMHYLHQHLSTFRTPAIRITALYENRKRENATRGYKTTDNNHTIVVPDSGRMTTW